ncbi:unnamed protein product [Closterium sp. Naga37s-1]|nr:unnamed protein product [Closterium sp. Naga37s-1]
MASGSAAAGNGSAAVYADELAAAESAVRLACALCETVQRGLKAEESASKSDESPVTIADYGSQVLVAWALQQHGLPGAFSMVAEEDSTQLTAPEGRGMLQRITALVNATIASSSNKAWGGGAAAVLSEAQVVALIDAGGAEGGSSGRHWVLDPIDGTRGRWAWWRPPCALTRKPTAGGKVCDAAGQPLDFSRGRFLDLDTGIIATNATLMPVLLSTVQSALNR